MCPHCRAFVTTDDKVCPYCDTPIGARAIDQREPDGLIGGLLPSARFITMLILIINSGLWVATILVSMNGGNQNAISDIDDRTLFAFGAKYNAAIFFGHQYWRLVTAGFLHSGLTHFLMNTWVLFDLSASVEQIFETSRTVVIYFVATVTGFLASAWWSDSLSVGASAGIYGLIGAIVVFGMRHRSALGDMIKTHYTRWAVYGLLIGMLPFFRIDNAAHIGGFIGGFATAWLAGEPRPTQPREKIWNALAVICAVLTGLSFLEMALSFGGPIS